MSQYNQNDLEKESLDGASKQGKKLGSAGAKKAAKVAGKALKKAIIATIKILVAHFSVVIGVLVVIYLLYHIAFSFQGTNQQYTRENENDTVLTEEGIPIATDETMTSESKTVRDFYKYHSGISYYQIVGDDNAKLISPDDPDAVQDYYKSAEIFKLNSNLLFSMDEYLFERKFRYPEQFIKPVAYNEDTLVLESLTDEQGFVIAESKELELETGKETGNMIKSVRDYGLASIVKYNMTEDWQKTANLKGTYTQKDVWDNNLKKVVKKSITPEPFNISLPEFTEKINLVEKIISFAGEIQYQYEYKESKARDISSGISTNAKDLVDRIQYGTYKEKIYKYELDGEGNQVLDDSGKPILVLKETKIHKLYKYRSSDSGIFERIPVQTNTTSTEKGTEYLYDYINNFESYVPSDVIEDFDFTGRIDYESIAFNTPGTLVEDYAIPMGTALDSKQFDNSLTFMPYIKKYADEFAIDPYVLLAMLTQESGGKNSNGNGLMQITSSSYTVTQKAKDENGVLQSVSVDLPERKDPDKAIRYGAAYLKRLMDLFDGNVYKAIQAYNLGEGTMNYLKKTYPSEWNSPYGWMIYREAARINSGGANTRSASYKCMVFPSGTKSSGSYWGDSCYVENVLRYYAGNDLDKIQNQGSSWNFFAAAGDLIKSFLPSHTPNIPQIEFSEDVNSETAEIILRTASAYDNKEYFTDVENYEDLNFWDEGFMTSMGSLGIGFQELMTLTGAEGEYMPPIVMGAGMRVSSPFGNRMHPIYKELRFHKGIDVAAPTGTPVYAIADGTIQIAKYGTGYGNYIKVAHTNNTQALYAHLSQIAVTAGQEVKAGQVIGYVGSTGDSTGAHLHFEFHLDGKPIDPISLVERTISIEALKKMREKIGSPYAWGAYGPDTFDCSGLIYWAYRELGYRSMPRTTIEQYTAGVSVSRQDIKPGDLIYFKNDFNDAPVNHVGIYVGKVNGVDQMLHAPEPGKSVEVIEITKYRWDRLVVIKRHQ